MKMYPYNYKYANQIWTEPKQPPLYVYIISYRNFISNMLLPYTRLSLKICSISWELPVA
jgi:hypothetical protein